MKDFFIYIEPVDQHCPRWIRTSTIHQVIPCDERSCHIQNDRHKIDIKINEPADHFLNRLEKQWQIRPTLCQQCNNPGTGANVLHPLCHQCAEKKVIMSNLSKMDCPNDPTHRHFQNFGQGMVCATCHAKAILTDLLKEEAITEQILPPLTDGAD